VSQKPAVPATCGVDAGLSIDFGQMSWPSLFHFSVSHTVLEEIMSRVNPIQLQKFLKGVDYPAKKAALIENAKNMGADENVCASLEQLPDEDFQTPADVSQAFGQLSDMPEQTASGTGGDEFLAQAMQDSLAELELCELALQKTANEDVKMFAQRMIDEHGQMGREIEQMAGKRKLELPKDVMPEHKSLTEQLSKLSGQDFDKKFMDHNVKEHEKDIKVFKHYTEQEAEPEIRALADKSVQMLSQHLEMARKIVQRI
jgi:putative membrane protein